MRITQMYDNNGFVIWWQISYICWKIGILWNGNLQLRKRPHYLPAAIENDLWDLTHAYESDRLQTKDLQYFIGMLPRAIAYVVNMSY